MNKVNILHFPCCFHSFLAFSKEILRRNSSSIMSIFRLLWKHPMDFFEVEYLLQFGALDVLRCDNMTATHQTIRSLEPYCP